jgi:hypothetical protein
MSTFPKKTSDITVGNWTTVQMSLTAGNDFGDTLPLDDLGGPGPYLVMDKGIWKYPQQAVGGRIPLSPDNHKAPIRLISILADFGASVPWMIHVAGSDGTAGGPDNLSGTPYAVADAALYREGDVSVYGETGRYVAHNFNVVANGITAIMHPGQRFYLTTAGAVSPVVRVTFAVAYDMK